MVHTFTGKNTFALLGALKQLVTDYEQRVGKLGIERFDASETDVNTLLQAVQSLPFLSPEKLIIMTTVQSNNALMERLEEFLARVSDGVSVVLVDPNFDKRKSAYKTLQKRTTLRDFAEPDLRSLPSWVIEYTKSLGGSIGLSEATFLVDRVGPHQQQLAREIEKLVNYSEKITSESIELLSDSSMQSTVFMLLEAVFSGDKQKAITLYREQRALQQDPHYLLAMFVWQLHAIAQAVFSEQKTESELIAAGQSSFTARKSLVAAKSISRSRMKRMITDLSELDLQTKSSVDADAALEFYILSI